MSRIDPQKNTRHACYPLVACSQVYRKKLLQEDLLHKSSVFLPCWKLFQLYGSFSNGAIVPSVHVGVFLVETLPELVAQRQLIPIHGADVGKLIARTRANKLAIA